jgi:hypothetical protein
MPADLHAGFHEGLHASIVGPRPPPPPPTSSLARGMVPPGRADPWAAEFMRHPQAR